MKRMLKTEIPIDDEWHTVETGPVCYVGQQNMGSITFWWEDEHVAPRTLRVFGTGQPIPNLTTWAGTVHDLEHGLVWHLLEVAFDVEPTPTSADPRTYPNHPGGTP